MMKRYVVVGASRGVGLAIVEQLSHQGKYVRAISRHPGAASQYVEPVAADVTNPASLSIALDTDIEAVFFTVESAGGINGRGLFGSRAAIREVTYQGCVNTLNAITQKEHRPRFILMSAMGADKPSMLWTISNLMKAGMRDNMIGRERAVQGSGLPYVILRSPILTDAVAGIETVSATPATHALSGSMKIGRSDIAAALIEAAHFAPSCSTWDVVPDIVADAPDWWRSTRR